MIYTSIDSYTSSSICLINFPVSITWYSILNINSNCSWLLSTCQLCIFSSNRLKSEHLSVLYFLHVITTWYSSCITLKSQFGQIRSSTIRLKCLPLSIIRVCELSLNFAIAALISGFFISVKYFSLLWLTFTVLKFSVCFVNYLLSCHCALITKTFQCIYFVNFVLNS